jgi:hypothetical protein
MNVKFSGIPFITEGIWKGVYACREDLVKYDIKEQNKGILAEQAYVNNQPIYLGKDQNYYRDPARTQALKDRPILSNKQKFITTLKPIPEEMVDVVLR